MEKIKTYEEAVEAINKAGFMPLSENPYKYVSLQGITDFSCWHTGSPYDPWIWKDKIALEKKAAYAKIFSHKPMFVSWEWYPVFLAYFRQGQSMDSLYQKGKLSLYAKQIYKLLEEHEVLNTHEIKSLLQDKPEKAKFENALTELQERMFITVCGASQKNDKDGMPYGWFITRYTLVERWTEEGINNNSEQLSHEEAGLRIREHIRRNLPGITDKNLERFIGVKI